jgi:hypothetical protein
LKIQLLSSSQHASYDTGVLKTFFYSIGKARMKLDRLVTETFFTWYENELAYTSQAWPVL